MVEFIIEQTKKDVEGVPDSSSYAPKESLIVPLLNNNSNSRSSSSSSQTSNSQASESSLLIKSPQSSTSGSKTICQRCHRVKRSHPAETRETPTPQSSAPETKSTVHETANNGISQSLYKKIYYSSVNMTENLLQQSLDKDSDEKSKVSEELSPLLKQPFRMFYESFRRRPIRKPRAVRGQPVQVRPIVRATPIVDNASTPAPDRLSQKTEALSERQLLCHTPINQSNESSISILKCVPQTSTPKVKVAPHQIQNADRKPLTTPLMSPVTFVDFSHNDAASLSHSRHSPSTPHPMTLHLRSKENRIPISPNGHLPICPKYKTPGARIQGQMCGRTANTKPYDDSKHGPQENIDLISEPIYEEICLPVLTPSKVILMSNKDQAAHRKPGSPYNPNKGQASHLYENAQVVKTVKEHTELRSISGLLRASSVDEWLRELRFFTDVECLNTLQGKPITTDPVITSALAIRDATEFIVKLQQRLHRVQQDITDAQRSTTTEVWDDLIKKVTNVCTEVRNLVKECVPYMDNSLTRNVKMISDLCCFIEQRAMKPPGQVPHRSREAFCSDLLGLREACNRMADYITLQEVKAVVECLEEKTLNPFAIKWSIFALVQMSQQSNKVALAITKVGGVQALLNVCRETKWKELWANALRALCLLCTSKHALIIFEKAGGIDCLASLLRNREDEEARREAAGLIAQITAPWMETPHPKGIDQNMGAFVLSLTDTARATKSAETFLLASAALANLSFLSSSPCEWMRRSETIEVLIDGCKRFSSENSLFIKDQVATVLANAAAVPSYKKELFDIGALVLLLCFLQLRPSVGHTEAESTSLEGIQEKAAIAVSRLCSEPAISRAVVQMQGVRRLVQLCKDAKERKFSDAVLVSCLAALRKIASVCGMEELKKYEACDLVTPKLWDSFLMCSYKQESYV